MTAVSLYNAGHSSTLYRGGPGPKHPHNQAASKQGQLFEDPLPALPQAPVAGLLPFRFRSSEVRQSPITICVPHASVLKPSTDKNPQLSRFPSGPLIF